jgi:hypothetical protein
MMRLIEPMMPRRVTVVPLVVVLTTRAAYVTDLAMAGTKLAAEAATTAKSLTTTLGTDLTAPMSGMPLPGVLVRAWLTRERASAPGKATTKEARAGMTINICSNVTSALATRSSVKGAPSMATQPRRAAYLMVSKASIAAAISKRSVPARLGPNDRLLV